MSEGGKRMSITDTAIARLRDVILAGELPPGSRLPPEQELAAQLGISRGSMREAVRALTYMGLVDVRRGDGTYVTELEPSQLLEGVRFAAQAARDGSVLDVMEVRSLLEPAAASLAATRISQPQLTELRTHLERMRSAAGDPARFVEHDAAFHDCIARATCNEWLAALLGGLAAPTIQARRLRAEVQNEVPAATIEQHEQILSALEDGDPELTRAAALIHVSQTYRGLRALLSASE
jgi:GntR family transcriptional regulator, transcriptional repressor for pyruvate dehydrogenase complex